MTALRYPVTEPHLDASDREHLLDAFDSGWISSQGPYLEKFERGFAEFAGTSHALATCNGTVALHLALMALEVGPGDEVIVPTFTYIASANAIRYCGATPVFVDCSPDTWNLDPDAVAAAISPRTVGILPVHLYGMPCDMIALRQIATRHGLWIVEDAAEAHGATIQDQTVGSFGTIASFSLFGNKNYHHRGRRCRHLERCETRRADDTAAWTGYGSGASLLVSDCRLQLPHDESGGGPWRVAAGQGAHARRRPSVGARVVS